jgi:[ribosomal protein S18]-alanine N-acetyltransferase
MSADLDALLALEHASFDHDRISRAQFRRHIAGDSASVLVIGPPGDIAAAAVTFHRRNSRCARLYSLAVAETARGRGYGAALLVAAETEAVRRGCTSMQLEVHSENAAAIALYERHGYRRIARLPGFYENGADAWRYAKSLTKVTP